MDDDAALKGQGVIARTVWHESANGRVMLPQGELPALTEPLVILGEAGMGKSHLLHSLKVLPGFAYCTARQLVNRHEPQTLLGDADTLLIDALDELSSQKDGDAVDLVLRQLGRLGYPRFVLACRVADWRSATGVQAIQEQYPTLPLELHLEPFSINEAELVLRASIGAPEACIIIEHFRARGLHELLGNPQTLRLIARIAGSGKLPDSRGELFERAVGVLRIEHQDTRAGDQLAQAPALAAAGAAFAGLILTGSEAIVRIAAANAEEGELQLVDISHLPGGDAIEVVLGTRLFRASGAERFTYLHRQIGEYLGARWLAEQADTPRKRKRLIALFQGHGLVPTSLRGVHAWLALDPALTQAVISADPMGLIEYGDPDHLTADQANELIRSLEVLAGHNPDFRDWGRFTLRGFNHPGVIEKIRQLLLAAETPFGLYLLMLEAIQGSGIAGCFIPELRGIMLSPEQFFAARKVAGEILVENDHEMEWPRMLATLCDQADQLSVRLAIELSDKVGYGLLSAELITAMISAYIRSGSHTIGVLMYLERDIPTAQIPDILDRLAMLAVSLGSHYDRLGNDVLTDLAYHLVVRVMEAGAPAADRLWSWLEPYHAREGYERVVQQRLHELLCGNDALRRATQQLLLLDCAQDGDPRQQSYRLLDRSTGFAVSESDAIALLDCLDPGDLTDTRWRDIVRLIVHDETAGVELRAAARPFAERNLELLAWLDGLTCKVVPEWQLVQVERERVRVERQQATHAEHRRHFSLRMAQMRAGEFGTVIHPAKAYLGLFNDVGPEAPAHVRIAQWLGEELAATAHEGFEAFLMQSPPEPSAEQIAMSLGEGQSYPAGYVIVAALAERLRAGIGFGDLPDERAMAGLFALRHTRVDQRAGIAGLSEALTAEVRSRGFWQQAMRLYHEPQLQRRRETVDGLYALLHDPDDVVTSTELAAEWLIRFPDLPVGPEMELVDRLMRSGRFEDLRRALKLRTSLTDVERRRHWTAVGLIVDFEETAERLTSSSVSAELLWYLRQRLSDRISEGAHVVLSVAQAEWVIATFRKLWPMVERPSGVTSGDSNPWDVSRFIDRFIRRLGNDPSQAASDALLRLRDAAADGYRDAIQVTIAEQTRMRVDASYAPHTLAAINAVVRNLAPVSLDDLQTLILEALMVAQAKIKSDDAESWRGFYDDNSVPVAEERCRDHLLGILRQGTPELTFEPETHVAADKEVDITCAVGTLRIPVEIKGQWHSELWHGADRQLDALYTRDWKAGGRGIYLVLWFGRQQQKNKKLKSPGRTVPTPESAQQLQDMLMAGSRAAREGRVSIFVLDLER